MVIFIGEASSSGCGVIDACDFMDFSKETLVMGWRGGGIGSKNSSSGAGLYIVVSGLATTTFFSIFLTVLIEKYPEQNEFSGCSDIKASCFFSTVSAVLGLSSI